MKIINFNRVIVYLTLSDVFTWGMILAINALTGLYLAQKLDIEAVAVIGIGTAAYSIARAASQIPVGILMDKIRKDKDDIWILTLGSVLIGISFLLFPIINSQYLYYFLQVIIGLGTAMNLVSWRKLFAKNLDKGKEGLEYASYDTIMSICIAAFGFTAGQVASKGGKYFDLVFIALGLSVILGGLVALLIFKVRRRVN